MRESEEIAERIQEVANNDFFGSQKSTLLSFLPFEYAKVFLIDEATSEEWDKGINAYNRETIIERMRKYMIFAWGKALDCRGLSASRSIDHFRAWLWLIEDDELLLFANDESNYSSYGAPILAKICEKYGFNRPGGELIETMIRGECNNESEAAQL